MAPVRLIPLAITATGLLLMAFTITTESEPGALPLAVVLVGAIWSVIAWRRGRGKPR